MRRPLGLIACGTFVQIIASRGRCASLCLFAASCQGPSERRLLEYLFTKSGYNRLERPVQFESEPLNVTFGLTLQQIIDVVSIHMGYGRMTVELRRSHTSTAGAHRGCASSN